MGTIGEPLVLGPGEGETISRPGTGGAATIKLSSVRAGGALTVYESGPRSPDDAGPGIHSHPGFDEMFYVLRGTFEFAVGDKLVAAGEGSFVYVPRGAFHGFRTTSEQDARLLTICAPGGIEELLDQAVRGSGASAEMP